MDHGHQRFHVAATRFRKRGRRKRVMIEWVMTHTPRAVDDGYDVELPGRLWRALVDLPQVVHPPAGLLVEVDHSRPLVFARGPYSDPDRFVSWVRGHLFLRVNWPLELISGGLH